jgi:hypothetical protein
MYSFVYSKSRNRLGVNKAKALVYIYTNLKLLRQRMGADLMRWYDNNFFLEDLDPDDKGQETESEGNDDNGNDNDGVFEARGAQTRGTNELMAQQAPNNNVDSQNANAFD